MRKGFGLTVLLILSFAGVHLLFPEWANARWREILALAGAQIDAELATWEELNSGRLQLGVLPVKSDAKHDAPVRSRPISAVPLKAAGNSDIAERPPAGKSVRPVAAPAPLQKPVPESNHPVAATGSPPPAEAMQGGTPESKLGEILKHENRPEQMKEETFWTEEKIQEAIKNGPPRQRSAPCIAFCDKNNTVIEINTPD